MKRLFLGLSAFFICACAFAQLTLEDVQKDPRLSAVNLRIYPVDEIGVLSEAPTGYKPFYAYYIGRHGSRYLTGKTVYSQTLSAFETAASDGALTEVGWSVLRRLRVIAADADGKVGHLTRTGERQLYGIAQRMYANYPEIFAKKDLQIEAISTGVRRVIGTMNAYCTKMQELNPSAQISTTVGSPIYGEWGSDTPGAKDCKDADTPFAQRLKAKASEYNKPDRLMALLFIDPSYPESIGENKQALMNSLQQIAGIAQSVDLEYQDYNLYDIFTAEELYHYSVLRNYEFYVKYGSSPETAKDFNHMIHKPMELMIERAENAWKDGGDDAFLVFCHDGNIGSYAPALQIPWAYSTTAVDPEDVALVYSAGEVVPMAANLQFIFYKNKKGNVLVKVLLNEREAVLPIGKKGTPYNDWETFKKFVLSK